MSTREMGILQGNAAEDQPVQAKERVMMKREKEQKLRD